MKKDPQTTCFRWERETKPFTQYLQYIVIKGFTENVKHDRKVSRNAFMQQLGENKLLDTHERKN